MRTPWRLVSIDPGTRKSGFAVLEIHPVTGELFVVDAWTLDVDKITEREHGELIYLHGMGVARQIVLQDSLWRILDAWRPATVASESPYFSGLVSTFRRLTEAVAAFRVAVTRYDAFMQLFTYEPSVAKTALHVPGNSNDKELVREAIRAHPTLCRFIDLDLLDEHAVDAILIGYCHYMSRYA